MPNPNKRVDADLKPCPFCGLSIELWVFPLYSDEEEKDLSENDKEFYADWKDGKRKRQYSLFHNYSPFGAPTQCILEGTIEESNEKDELIKLWNKRVN